MKYFFIVISLIFSLSCFSQNESIIDNFDTIVNNSNNWKKFRVIDKTKLADFRKQLISSTGELNNTIDDLEQSIEDYKSEIDNLQQNNQSLKNELEGLQQAKDEIDLFGLKLSKPNYHLIVWSIILFLVIVLAFVFIKYRNRNIVTQELKENLDNTTAEFEDYKHRSIEKQQKLGRELLDAKKAAQSTKNKN